jgi:hypothetical protein
MCINMLQNVDTLLPFDNSQGMDTYPWFHSSFYSFYASIYITERFGMLGDDTNGR